MFFLLHQPHHAKLGSASPVQLGVNLHTFRKKNSYKRTFSRLHFMQLPPARASSPFQQKNQRGGSPGCSHPSGAIPRLRGSWECLSLTHNLQTRYPSFLSLLPFSEKMSTPSGLTDQVASSMQPWSPALAGPTLISWTIFLAIKLGSCVQCCPV